MSEPSGRVRRVTYAQLEQLCEYLHQNRGIALGYNKTIQAREDSRRTWEAVTLQLNAHGDGATKDWKGWNKYWIDYKGKFKKVVALNRTSQHGTGGGPATVKPLTEIERRFLAILEEDFGSGIPGVQVEPFAAEEIHEIETVDQPGPSGLQGFTILPTISSESPPLPHIIREEILRAEEEDQEENHVPSPEGQTRNVTPHHQRGHARRRRSRRDSLSADDARRVMIQIAERRTQIESDRNEIFKELTGSIISLIRQNNTLLGSARRLNESSDED